MKTITLIQDRPKDAERFAEHFEALAQQARAGEITGHSGILTRPGGKYSTIGFQGRDGNAFEEIGIHITCILDIWQHSVKE